MMARRTRSESGRLAALIRGGKATSEEITRFEELDAQERPAWRASALTPTALYDLPIFERMWRADAQQVNR